MFVYEVEVAPQDFAAELRLAAGLSLLQERHRLPSLASILNKCPANVGILNPTMQWRR